MSEHLFACVAGSSARMRATLLLVAMALVLAPVTVMAPEASAHPVCVGDSCACPPNNEGTHVHVNPADRDACADL